MKYHIRVKIKEKDVEGYKVEASSEEEAIRKCKENYPIIYYNYENRNNKE